MSLSRLARFGIGAVGPPQHSVCLGYPAPQHVEAIQFLDLPLPGAGSALPLA